MGEKCARVWKLYEERRQEYLERSSAPAESAWPAAGEGEGEEGRGGGFESGFGVGGWRKLG